MLEELRGKGVDLGITTSQQTDEIYIDRADYMPLHYMLTESDDHYGRQPSAVKFDLAERAENVIFARYYQNTELNIPVGLQPTEQSDIDRRLLHPVSWPSYKKPVYTVVSASD